MRTSRPSRTVPGAESVEENSSQFSREVALFDCRWHRDGIQRGPLDALREIRGMLEVARSPVPLTISGD